VSRRKRRQAARPRGLKPHLPLIIAYAAGLLCIGGGVVVLAFGAAEPQGGELPAKGSVTHLGVSLIALGLLAIGLTGYMHWTKRRK